ncbi:FAS1-like dehydratase domain-containing protein [Nocardia higoensis]|uniref:FAS1-like dehydratase domain-containing protein n=1 Tax=Nocardia higoensis TaxID=228599 RepID=UPI00030FB360|nr:MaoC family dehydratase N-terminal domain-containing protein [Nocardia higoensis]
MAVRRFPIEGGHVLMFARAIGEADALYSDERAALDGLAGVAVPPTFVQCSAQFDPDFPLRPQPGRPWFGSGPSGSTAGASGGRGERGSSASAPEGDTDSADRSDNPSGGSALHAEQRFDYLRPVRVGDVLSATQRAGRTWEKEGRRGGKLVFTESITEYRDAAGELVVTATAVAVRTRAVPARSSGSEDRS